MRLKHNPFTKKHADTYASTHVGKVRKNNEDALIMMPSRGCYAVSDGMGGGKAGEVASAMMVQELEKAINETQDIPGEREGAVIRSAYKINFLIKDYAIEHEYSSMGATFICLIEDPWHPDTGTIFHAGDSRVYRIRTGKIELLMEDHTVATSSFINEAKIAPMFRGVLTNALGTGADFYLERTSVDIQNGDLFILCSDGLSRMLKDSEIQQICAINADESSKNICNALIEAALDSGGRDNVSVITVKIKEVAKEYVPTQRKQLSKRRRR